MKKIIYIIIPALMLTMMGVGGCEKAETVNSNETWVWSMEDSLIVTLNLYPNEGKFYTRVVGNIPANSGIKSIMFGDDVWSYYKMVGDIMYIRHENEEFPTQDDRYNKWLIRQHTEQYLEMEYAGTLPAIPIITYYLFNSQN
ncbi:MAG: hypothetical protein LBB41_01415 [Prevotellaceae bacterium]|jgi:hypothetical protein|nr:hypothetical protein [Prevotellaceae bacterium]